MSTALTICDIFSRHIGKSDCTFVLILICSFIKCSFWSVSCSKSILSCEIYLSSMHAQSFDSTVILSFVTFVLIHSLFGYVIDKTVRLFSPFIFLIGFFLLYSFFQHSNNFQYILFFSQT